MKEKIKLSPSHLGPLVCTKSCHSELLPCTESGHSGPLPCRVEVPGAALTCACVDTQAWGCSAGSQASWSPLHCAICTVSSSPRWASVPSLFPDSCALILSICWLLPPPCPELLTLTQTSVTRASVFWTQNPRAALAPKQVAQRGWPSGCYYGRVLCMAHVACSLGKG